MAEGAPVDVSTASTLAIGGYSAQLTNFSHTGIARPAVDTTYLGTPIARTFMPGDLYDPGQFEAGWWFHPGISPPITADAAVITATFPDPAGADTPASWAASGFLTEFSYDVPEADNLMTATGTAKLSGQITF